jgi:hypothetical protein
MKTDDLIEKRISLGKCVIRETDTYGIYSINNIANVAAIGPHNIMTGELDPDDNEPLTDLDEELLGVEVALVKQFVLGAITAYKIVDLSSISLPRFLNGNGDRR